MSGPMVTAVMMTHNRTRFARKAIELFLAQTWINKELLIIDDSTVPVSEKLPPQVRRIKLSDKTWITRKRVIGFTHARGDLICGWDDDDYFGPTRLQVQADELLNSDADVCGFPLNYVVDLPGVNFSKARLGAGRAIMFHDGVAMGWRSVFTGATFLQDVDRGGLYVALRERLKVGGSYTTLPNLGHFVYVRHPHSVWGNTLTVEPTAAPGWLPEHVTQFWHDPELVNEGATK